MLTLPSVHVYVKDRRIGFDWDAAMPENRNSSSEDSAMPDFPRIVVTGVGLVTPLGLDVPASWTGMLAGLCVAEVNGPILGKTGMQDHVAEAALPAVIHLRHAADRRHVAVPGGQDEAAFHFRDQQATVR